MTTAFMGTAFTDELLQEVVNRLLAVSSPEKIILFGSRARGEAKPDSDVDLLVIDPDRHLENEYREAVDELEVDVDLIVQTPAEVASWQEVSNHLLTEIVREGRVLYERRVDLIRESVSPKSQADHAREFVQLADGDLQAAELLLQAGGRPVVVCFHVQQAIEKYLKAILAFKRAEIPRTHNLRRLRKRLAQSPRRLRVDWRVSLLSRYAVRGRYESRLKADEKFAAWAVQLARETRQVIVQELPPEAIPP